MIKKRRSISLHMWETWVAAIRQRVCAHPLFLEADTIYVYLDIPGEVGTRKLVEEAWKQKKIVAVPKVSGDTMEFYEIHSFEDVKPGTFQVEEPLPCMRFCRREGLVLMPGVVFDETGHRIGYGKGYYDRYLSQRKHLSTMALAFEMQIMKQVPFEHYDYSPDYIVTEQRTFQSIT